MFTLVDGDAQGVVPWSLLVEREVSGQILRNLNRAHSKEIAGMRRYLG